MTTMIQTQVDDDLKADSDEMWHQLGADINSAIRIFLKASLRAKGFPFQVALNDSMSNPYKAMSEEELLSRLELSRKHAEEGKYRDGDTAVVEMRAKYGL